MANKKAYYEICEKAQLERSSLKSEKISYQDELNKNMNKVIDKTRRLDMGMINS